ncbi:cache domain-containing protein [Vibrio hippocampi]|nr:cache domain-containing protein [Vibrio hippocampi]
MSLKVKLILLTLLPLVILTSSVGWIVFHQAKSLGASEIQLFNDSLARSKESALKDSVQQAVSAIWHVYQDESLDMVTAQQRVKAIVNQLRYGTDGYFFVYDKTGRNLVHPILPNLVGQELIKLQDENGDYVIEALLFQAQSGGGFHQYQWQKPSTGEVVTKLSYAAWLDDWQWMIGTGLYIEDIALEVTQLTEQIDANIETTMFSIATIFCVTVAVIVVLTLAVNWHEHKLADRHLKELSHKTVMFQEAEKKHIAQELHDGVNQLLASGKCHLELVTSTQLDANSVGHLDQAQDSLSEAILEVRRISHRLRPSALDDIGLDAAIKTLLEDFGQYSIADTELVVDLPKVKLKSEVATTLYRVVQESLNNIEKHAQATQVSVYLQRFNQRLQLIVRDNGIGFDARAGLNHQGIGFQGIGLRNMRERVEFIGGEFDLHSEYGAGTEVTVLLYMDGENE